MEPRKLSELTAAMMIANMTEEKRDRCVKSPRWAAANNVTRPHSGKNRSKVKAARKQRKATK